MKDIIVVYPAKSTAMAIRDLLENNQHHVTHICALGSSALEIAHNKRDGIIICPFIMGDMSSSDLAESVPEGFDIVALSKEGSSQYMGNLITLPMPIDMQEFLQTITVLENTRSGFTHRSDNDEDVISKAKEILMAHGMTEMAAHKYLQKESMTTGNKLAKVAMDILDKFA